MEYWSGTGSARDGSLRRYRPCFLARQHTVSAFLRWHPVAEAQGSMLGGGDNGSSTVVAPHMEKVRVSTLVQIDFGGVC